MNKHQPRTKSQHYVPESYLKRFTDANGFLFIRDKNREHIRRQKPNKVMKIDSYYRQTWIPNGIDPNILEICIASIENDAKFAIDCLLESPASLTKEYAEILLEYLEAQRIRVPRQAVWAKELLNKNIHNITPSYLREQIESCSAELVLNDTVRFDFMKMACDTLHPWFARMEWEVVEAGCNASFITTDSPVSFYNPKFLPPAEAGIGLAGTIVLFPLSSQKLLLLRHPECRYESALTILPNPTMQSNTLNLLHGAVWNVSLVKRTNWKLARLAHELYVAESERALAYGLLTS